jgi:amino acid adenylation domain-containing protein
MQTQVDGFRLSPQQKRLWLIQQQDQSPAYRAQCALLLEGQLAVPDLKKSLHRAVERHEILRTLFQRPPGMKWPVQVISDSFKPLWQELDFSDLDSQAQRDRVEEVYRSEMNRPFDYEHGPLIRVYLINLASDRNILILSLPAFYAGNVSLKNFVKEISECYSSCAEPVEEEELLQYVQFSEWQNEMLEDEEAERGRAYWSEQNPGAVSPLVLPMEKKAGAEGTFLPETVEAIISGEEIRRINKALEGTETTAIAFLLSCWQTLLWRLTGQSDLVVSCVFEGRKYEELQESLGLIAKTLPIRAQLSEELRFSELLRHTGVALHEAYEWQEYFTWKEEEELCFNAVDEVCMAASFEFDHWPARRSSQGISFTLYRRDVCHDRYKLRLSCSRTDDSLITEFSYDPQLFKAEDIKRLAKQFQKVLASVASNLEMEISRLEVLGDEERQQLLFDFNQTRADYPQEKCLNELFEAQVERTPQAVAVMLEDEQLSYAELNARANQLARHLLKFKVGPEVLVGICVERSLDMVVGMLGVLKAGGAYVPLDPQYPQERLQFMLEDIRPPVLLTQEGLLEKLPEHQAHVIYLDSQWEEIAHEPVENLPQQASSVNLAYVIYTSGSTGKPKGVMITHQGLVNYLVWSANAYVSENGRGAPVHSPFGFDLTITSLYLPLITGRSVVLIAEEKGIEGLSEILRSMGNFSLVKITPSHLEVLKQWLPEKELAGATRSLVIGGEALLEENLSYWRANAPETRLINEYGPTETVVGCCTYEVPSESPVAGPVPIGRPISNTQLYLLDGDWQPTPFGVAGELYIGGTGVARGYLNRPDLTAERFIPNPFSEETGARLYRTGDLARYLSDGNIEYLGRNDEQVKVRGYRIELGEIEAALAQHEAVRETVVLAREDTPGDRRLVAYVVHAQEEAPHSQELRSYLKERLPEYMVPALFVPLKELPLTPNGKIDRRALSEPGFERPDLENTYVAPRTDLEEVLAAVWAEVLKIERVGVHDNFFDLGGDSIRSVRVVALAKARGVEFTVQQIFRAQTVAELAQEILTGGSETAPTVYTEPFSLISEEDRLLLPKDVEDAYPLAGMQAGMLYHMGLTPDSPAYHNVNSWHLRAPYDLEAFLEATRQIVARHAVLRTSFDLTTYSQPLQLVHREAVLPLEVFDIRHLSFDEQSKALYDFLEIERKRMFDMSHPSLMRFFIHRRSDDTFQFSFTENHAIIDGWSTTSSLAELFDYYLALIRHEPPPVEPPITITYRDFVHLEQQALASQETRDYWLSKMSEGTPVKLPRWPYSTPTSNLQRIAKLALPISPELLAALRRVAHTTAVPLKTVMFAAHIKVMSMISGQTDLLIGTTTNGRPEEIDGTRVRGNFLNTVPFRFQLKDETWADLIKEVFEAEWEMLPHRRYPLASLQKMWGREQLIETSFAYLHFHSVEEVLRPDKIEMLNDNSIDLSETNFSLQTVFIISPTSPDTVAWVELQYMAATTGADQREAIRGYYDRVLHALAADPLARHQSQTYLSPEEEQKVLSEWNDTATESTQQKCFHELFEAQVERTPDAVAVTYKDERLSYRELNERANQVAHYLRRSGVEPEAIVGVCVERSLEMLICLLGVLKSGAAYVPLDPTNPPERLAFILEDARAPVLLTQQSLMGSMPANKARVIALDTQWDEIRQESTENPRRPIESDNLAYIIYTSGSTGKPKGTLVTHRGLTNYLTWSINAYPVEQGSGAPVFSSISFDLTVTALYAPLLVGRMVEMLPTDVGVETLTKALKKDSHYGLIKITPAQLELLGQRLLPEEAPSHTRAFVIGGENLRGDILQFWRDASPDTILINEYGPSETVVGCCTYQVPDELPLGGSVPIGRPIANTQLYLLNSHLQPAPIGTAAELYISGAGLARGYLNHPELTADKFIPNPFSSEPGARLYRTGDLARYLPDGNIEFLGRVDHQIKIHGYRVEVGEVETILNLHPAIRESFVMPYEDAHNDRHLVAYLVAAQEPTPSVTDLRNFIKDLLPEYMIPSSFMWLEALPHTASGKIDRRALPPPDHSRPQLVAEYVPPRNEVERTISDIWKDVLEVEQVGIHDNFFDLGGDSFRAYEVHSKLRKQLHDEISMVDMFQYSTVATLAKYVARGNGGNGGEASFEKTQDRAQKRKEAASRRKQIGKGKVNTNG